MKFVRYQTDAGPAYGSLEENGAVRAVSGDIFGEFDVGRRAADMDDLKILAPVDPTKLIGVGGNYLAHLEEGGEDAFVPQFPMVFQLPSTSVIGPGDSIVIPDKAGFTHAINDSNLQDEPFSPVDYESELVAVIGKPCHRINPDEALDYVLGYSCGNDVSARPLQLAEMATGVLMLGKGLETFKPLGPVIATDLDPTNLRLRGRHNGVVTQDTNTSDLLFSVASLVTYLAQAIRLEPGDCIYTGTPSGGGSLVPGDTIEVELEGIGVLSNPVVAG